MWHSPCAVLGVLPCWGRHQAVQWQSWPWHCCVCPCRAADSRALDPRPERGPRGRRGASAAESTTQTTQSCHLLKASCLSNREFSCAAALQSGDDRGWIQKIKQAAEELLVFCIPSFSQFASRTCLARCKGGNNRCTASGYFIKGIVGVF